jgi:aspartate racemase
MKTIGLIGGTSWVSTVDYYRVINQETNRRLGGINSAKILLYSVNYHEFRLLADAGNWEEQTERIADIAIRLQQARADCILLCANTMHMVADRVQSKINIPLLHIADVTAREIENKKLNKVALLGTKFTMEQTFFTTRLQKAGIESIIPNTTDREFIHHTIFEELGAGLFYPETKTRYLSIIDGLLQQGAEGIIFGCTEIPLLIPPAECSFPVFDTLEIHAKNAVAFALGL